MEDAFVYVLFGVVIIAAIIAVATLAGSGETYRQIGRGGLSLHEDEDDRGRRRGGGGGAPPGSPGAGVERDAEIRQMLEARNDRRTARGEPPVDVEDELRALTSGRPGPGAAAPADPALTAEVRDLVVARNERRARQGEPPLDVEAEVERQLRELGG